MAFLPFSIDKMQIPTLIVVVQTVGALLIVYVLYSLICIYHLYYIHPLRRLPGPWLWITFPIFHHVAAMRGVYDVRLREYHLRYGKVIRYGPNEVSFITAQAWKDIYSRRHPQLPKVVHWDSDVLDIIDADIVNHARHRKSMANAFSEKALKDQEPVITGYIDLLIQRLKGLASSGEPADMVKWYNLVTFDLIGDLAFGESFNGLKSGQLHQWISFLFDSIKILPYLVASKPYPFVIPLIALVMPIGKMKRGNDEHERRTKELVTKRLNNTEQQDRNDFMDSMLKDRNTEGGLSDEEIEMNSQVLIVAGSETSASLLSGLTYYLLRTPGALHKVTNEVRSTFKHDSDINFVTASSKLPYMLACIDEAFRMYPPVPTGRERSCPPGPPTPISGHLIPAGTVVSVHQSAAGLSPLNFHLPTEYHPERWLPTDPTSPFHNDDRAVVQPFSVGPRNCIGQNLAHNELRLILSRVLWNFDLELCDESMEWTKGQRTFFIWERRPLMCWVRKRGDLND